ncbi:MAG: Mov34/MPN/PAD-1 family protein [Candidatus Hodarchaeota archaeon]
MIRISKEVYMKFLRFALENANPLDTSHNWKECIGLVLGRIIDQEIVITDIVPIGTGTTVFVDITDYEKVFSLVSTSRIDEGEVIVGWAHTHPGLGLFFSSTDIKTQKLYQQILPQAFGLVLDPMKITRNFGGFNIFRVDKTGVRTTSADFILEDQFDFLKIRDNLISELHLVPPIPLPEKPILHSNKEVSWKAIHLLIQGPSEIIVNQEFQVKIVVKLPFRQFIRVDYQISVDNSIEKHISINLIRSIYHEVISSGSIGIFTFKANRIGSTQIKLQNLFLTDYRYQKQKLPELRLIAKVQNSKSPE